MKYSYISKEMSSLYLGLDVFSQFEELDAVLSLQCTDTVCVGGGGWVSNSGTLVSNRQNRESPKYNDDISLLISQYFISG